MTLIWTRSVRHWPEDAKLFHSFPQDVLHLPCIRTFALDATIKELFPARRKLWVFTSRTGSEIFLQRQDLLRQVGADDKILCLGPKTAVGFNWKEMTPTWPENCEGGKALGEYIDRFLPKDAVVCVGAVKRAFDLAGFLRERGYDALALDVYVTEEEARDAKGHALTKETVLAYTNSLVGEVAFASPSAVQGFVKVFHPASNRLKEALKALAIGKTTEQEAKLHFREVRVASEHSMKALASLASYDSPF